MSSGKHKIILIIEDEIYTANLISEILKENGYVTVNVPTGEEAVARIDEINPSLMLIDIFLAGKMTGIDMAVLIQQKYDVPMIFLTNYSDDDLAEKISIVNHYGCLLKPVTARDLYVAVEIAFHKHEVDKKLHESEKKYRELVESVNSIILKLDPDGVILYVNEYAEYFFGYPGGELIGKNVIGTIVPLEDSLGNDLSNLMGEISGTPNSYEVNENENVKKTGERVWLSWTNRTIYNESGNVAYILCVGNDITEQKQTYLSLQKSEELFRKFFEQNLIGCAITAPDGKWISVNDKLCTILGYARAELTSLTWPDITHKDGLSDELAVYKRVLKGELTSMALNKKYIKKDGEVIDAAISAKAIRDDNGDVDFFVVLVDDITERMRAENELLEANNRFRNILEFLPDAVFVIDKDQKVIAWNRALERMVGVTQEQMLGMGDYEYAIPFYGTRRQILIDAIFDDFYESEDRYALFEKEGDTVLAETHVEKLPYTGKELYLWGKASPLYDSEGNLAGAIEIVRDITEYKKAEELLKISEAMYRSIFELAGTTIIIINREGFITLANKRFVEMSGLTREAIEGKMMAGDFIVPEDRDRVENNRKMRLQDPSSMPPFYETRLVGKNGNIYDVLLGITLVEITGDSIVSITDLTDLKRLEKEVLEISIREQQRIGRSLHDDIGQLLTGTGFLCESLIKKLSKKSMTEVHEAEKIYQLLDQARDHTRALARALYPVDVYAGGLVDGLSRLAVDFEHIYGVTCAFLRPSEMLRDMIVETQLYYIAQESIVNAVRHGKAKNIKLELHYDGTHLRMTIQDDGTGIKNDGQAEGMGIQIMKYRARAIGASLNISPVHGGGTIVYCIR